MSQWTIACSPRRDRVGLGARLGVDLPQQRLAEVRQRRAGKAADEALRPDDAELQPVDLAARGLALEKPDSRPAEHLSELVGAARMVVVVAEHGEDRHVELPARSGDHLGLLRLAARREIAGEQDDVGLAAEIRERALDALGAHVRGVDVGCGRNPHHAPHVADLDNPETNRQCRSPASRS